MKNIAFWTLLCLLLFSCRKDFDTDLSTAVKYEPPVIEVNVTASIEGIILDEAGQPVDQAMVRIDNRTTSSNPEGLFIIDNMTMNQTGTLISVEKEGFFQGSMRFFPKESSKNFATLTLLEKQSIGTFDPTVGGEVSSTEGILLDFPANSVVDANNQTYTGTVTVAARWLDPEAENLFEIMPGNLQGINQEDREVALVSFGMMGVELLDDNGNELQLGNGQKASLSFPLSANYQSKAPAEIPLWHFEEDSGLWEEEGKATLQGNYYVGEVSHFSFWNCDDPYPLVQLSGRVLANNANGEAVPVANAYVKISTSGLGCGYGYTDKDGYFKGAVPRGVELELAIADHKACNSTLYTATLDPVLLGTNLGDLFVDMPVENHIEISGSLLDCLNEPLNDAWLRITIDGKNTFHHVDANTFNISVFNCDNASDLQLVGVDFKEEEESDPLTLPVQTEVEAGSIKVCGNTLVEFFELNFGVEDVYTGRIQMLDEKQFFLQGTGAGGEGRISLTFTGSEPVTPGVYGQNNALTFSLKGDINVGNIVSGGCSGPNLDCVVFSEIKITQYSGVVGDYAKGSFSGAADLRGGTVDYLAVPFSCNFSIPLEEL